MTPGIRGSKDFWAGAIYIAFGVAALWIGAEYKMGTAGRMGPGYFPKVLAGLLIAIGAVALARSLVAKGAAVGTVAWKPLILVLLATALFGLLINTAGLILALLALALVSAAASREFKLDWRASLGLLGLIAFCALVFVKGLGMPMPLLGSWITLHLGAFSAWLG